jgi:hypothetical protein
MSASKCQFCDAAMSSRFCELCGHENKCTNCGSSIMSQFCIRCGTAVAAMTVTTDSPISTSQSFISAVPNPNEVSTQASGDAIVAAGTLASVISTSEVPSESEISEPVDRRSHRQRRFIALSGAVIVATVVGLGIFIVSSSRTSRSTGQDAALMVEGSVTSSLETESAPETSSSTEAPTESSGLPVQSTNSGNSRTTNQQGGNLAPSPPGTLGVPLPSPTPPLPYTVPTFTRMLASNALAVLESARHEYGIGVGWGNECLSPGAYVTYMHSESPLPGSVVIGQIPRIVIFCDSQPFNLPNYVGLNLCSQDSCGGPDGILYPRWDPSCIESSENSLGIRSAVITRQSPAPGTFFWPRDDELSVYC